MTHPNAEYNAEYKFRRGMQTEYKFRATDVRKRGPMIETENKITVIALKQKIAAAQEKLTAKKTCTGSYKIYVSCITIQSI